MLWHEGDVRDPTVIATALLHDTIEDTETTPQELRGIFGEIVADIVSEVTDTKWLKKDSRKRLQVSTAAKSSHGARLVKLADKICNLRDIIPKALKGWSIERKREYFDWTKDVHDNVRDSNEKLERRFDQVYEQRP